MGDGFDLRDEPWIPVRWGNGKSSRCGLRELFHRAHEVIDLELPVPPAAAGLLRVLVVMAVRIAGDGEGVRLDDENLAREASAWLDARNAALARGRFDSAAVDAYFDRHVPAGRFDLFDPARPFLQDPRLAQECRNSKGVASSSGVNKLCIGRPTGVNGAVLFGHFTDTDPVPIPSAEAAWFLLAHLYNGASGQCTPRQIANVKTRNVGASPLRGLVSYFPWGPNLFNSLVLAMPAPVPEFGHNKTHPRDKAPWEAKELPDPLGPLPPLTWPSGLLTGRFRHAVLLVPSQDRESVVDSYITWATHAPAPSAHDPYVILDRRGDGIYQARDAEGHRALWRDLDALLLKDSNPKMRRPTSFNNIPQSWRSRLVVRAYGFDQERSQVIDRTWFEATMPAVLQWQEEADPAMAQHVARCRQAAEAAGHRLVVAARLAWKLATDVNATDEARPNLDRKKLGPWAAAASHHYWARAESEFWQLTSPHQRNAPALPVMVQAAVSALDEAIGRVARADIRVAHARFRAHAVLRSLLRTDTA
ncbi:type I-E CRISPR-associated protein Cse1/CasA [Streptomyces collinus]|uniref:type I-E CRISPR-associated protein Cse1/CasA n=1 Tax=Streptomyces collinus TaxID=42684 RepID=UPI0036B73646